MTISINGAGALFTLPKSTLSAVFGSPPRIENILNQAYDKAISERDNEDGSFLLNMEQRVEDKVDNLHPELYIPYLYDMMKLVHEIQEINDNLIGCLSSLSDNLVNVIPFILLIEANGMNHAEKIDLGIQSLIEQCSGFNKYIPPFKQAYGKILAMSNKPRPPFLPSTISTDISKEVAEISIAVDKMQGVYESLSSDFQAAIHAPVNSDCPFLKKLQEKISKNDWITLKQEAIALRNSLINS